MTPQTNKDEVKQRDHLGMDSRKTIRGLKQVLFVRNLTLNSDAAPNYKIYRFGPSRGPNITVKPQHNKTTY